MNSTDTDLNSGLESSVNSPSISGFRDALKGKLTTCLDAGEQTLKSLENDAWGTYYSLIVRNSRIRYLLATLDDKPYTEEEINKMLQEYNV